MLKKTIPTENYESEHCDIESGDEDEVFRKQVEISDKTINELNKDHKLKFEICKKCFVVRFANTR